MAGGGFVLGVDFGTSNTVAMLRRPDGRVAPLLFDGGPVLPSAVCAAPGGGLSVGRDALHHGRHHPDALEPNPKRRIDDGVVLLGADEYPVPDVVGAVFDRVGHEAARVAGRAPDALVLSHPAGWGPVRRLTLGAAAAVAGLPPPIFVTEPAAAARYFVSVLDSDAEPGTVLMVYDFGAGTFDVSLLRIGDDLDVLGIDGLDVGGLDLDAAVVDWLRDRYDAGTWARLERPTTPDDRRLRHELWTEARVAKEMLTRASSALLRPPLLDAEVPLTLAEFEGIVQPLVDRTVRTAQGLARHCAVDAGQLLLVGGSSRIPLVATALHRAFGVPPTVTEQPETVVAAGCVIGGSDGAAAVRGSGRPVWPATSRAEPVLPAQREARATETAAGVEPPVVLAPRVGAGISRERDPDGDRAARRDAAPVARRSTSEARSGDGPPRPPPRQLRSPTSVSREAAQDAGPDATTVALAPGTPARPAGPVADSPPASPPAAAAAATEPLKAEPPATEPGRRGRISRLAAVLLSVLALLLAGAAVLFVTFGPPGDEPNDDPETRSGTVPATTPGPSFPTWPVRYTDSLASPRGWTSTTEPAHSADCTFRNNRLEIEMRIGGIFRCQGQRDELTDFALRVDVYLIDGRSCAGIWFRRQAHENDQDSGYLLRICATELVLGHHHADGKIEDFRRFPVAQIAPGTKATLGLVVRRNEIGLYLNDAFVGRDGDTLYPGGRVALGIAVPREVGTGRIGFANIQLRTP